jgi:hypothetical protein
MINSNLFLILAQTYVTSSQKGKNWTIEALLCRNNHWRARFLLPNTSDHDQESDKNNFSLV